MAKAWADFRESVRGYQSVPTICRCDREEDLQMPDSREDRP